MNPQEIELTEIPSSSSYSNPGFSHNEDEPIPGPSSSVTNIKSLHLHTSPESPELSDPNKISKSTIEVEDAQSINSHWTTVSSLTPKSNWHFFGITFTLLYTFFNSFVTLLVKSLLNSDVYSPVTIIIWKQLGSTIPSIYIFIYLMRHENPHHHHTHNHHSKSSTKYDYKEEFNHIYPFRSNLKNCILVCISTIFASLGTIIRFYSLSYLTIVDATAINYMMIVFVMIFAYFFLQEQLSIVQLISSLVIVVGVIIISLPSFIMTETNFNLMIGIGLKLLDTTCGAIFAIICKRLAEIHYIIVNLTCGLIGLTLSITASLSLSLNSSSSTQLLPISLNDTGSFILIGICTFMSHFLLTLAFRYENLGPVSIFRTFEILVVIMLQIEFLNEYPGLWTLFGCILITFGVILVGLRKAITTFPEESSITQKFGFLLK